VADSDQDRMSWRKSTASGDTGCAEVALEGDMVHMRHSQDPSGHVLTFSMAEWAAFLEGARKGEFNFSVGSH
jgi:hypothetical protein